MVCNDIVRHVTTSVVQSFPFYTAHRLFLILYYIPPWSRPLLVPIIRSYSAHERIYLHIRVLSVFCIFYFRVGPIQRGLPHRALVIGHFWQISTVIFCYPYSSISNFSILLFSCRKSHLILYGFVFYVHWYVWSLKLLLKRIDLSVLQLWVLEYKYSCRCRMEILLKK
jgi:hypothetical protein